MRKDVLQSLIADYKAQQGLRRKMFPKKIILMLKECLLDFSDSDDITWEVFENFIADKGQSRSIQDFNWSYVTASVKLLNKIKNSSELSQEESVLFKKFEAFN